MFESFNSVLTTLGTIVGILLSLNQYFKYKTRRDKLMIIREAFQTVVKSLASDVEVERMSGAILLRRFHDQRSEVGIAGSPYGKEAIYVSTGILRGQCTGNFQKLVADGLAFALSLHRVDFQKTNLQFAYLGARTVDQDSEEVEVKTDLTYADFYRADLSHASLKKSNAKGAVFYQARMHYTVFSGADLRQANFYEADLHGAIFKGALLEKANFSKAKNLPLGFEDKLDEQGIYIDSKPFAAPNSEANNTWIFISKPGSLNYNEQQFLNILQNKLEKEGFLIKTLERSAYPKFGSIYEIQRLMSSCSGSIILGFKQLEVLNGLWLSDLKKEKEVKNFNMTTPWNQIEAGMAMTLGLPTIVISQNNIKGGVFDNEIIESEPLLYQFLDLDFKADKNLKAFDEWCDNVRRKK